jgi:ATP-binding cassette subfamily C (CFTR/MRP) protein 10
MWSLTATIVAEATLQTLVRAFAPLEMAIAATLPAMVGAAACIQYAVAQPVQQMLLVGLLGVLLRCFASGTDIAVAWSLTSNSDAHFATWLREVKAHEGASAWSYLTLSWLWPLLHAGLGRQLSAADVPALHSSEEAAGKATAHPSLVAGRSTVPAGTPPGQGILPKSMLLRVLWRHFGSAWLKLGVLQMVTVALGFAQPLLLAQLLAVIEGSGGPSQTQYWRVVALAAAMPLVSGLSALVGTAFNYNVARLQTRVRFLLVPAVFQACIAAPPMHRQQFSSGQVTDLFSVDVQQVMDLVPSAHQLWALPVQVAVTLFLLYQQVHWAFAAGAAVLAVFVPVNMVIARRIGALTQEMMDARDHRLAAAGELVGGMLGMKQLAWEAVGVVRVALARAAEMRFLGARKYLDALCVYLWAATPVLVSLATFGTLVLFQDRTESSGDTPEHSALTPSRVFTAVTLLNQLIFPLNAYAWVVTGVLQASVSAQRMALLLFGGGWGCMESPHLPACRTQHPRRWLVLLAHFNGLPRRSRQGRHATVKLKRPIVATLS